MSIGPSFSPSYVGPGTYTKVTYQTTPPSSLPPFVTALIGRTSIDKPETDTLVRNAVASQIVLIDPSTGVISISGTADTDETIRRDRLTDDNSGVILMGDGSVVVDGETFQQYFYGYTGDWVANSVSAKTYVEWIVDYGVKAVGTAPLFIGKAGVGTLPVLAARAAHDTLFSVPVLARAGTLRTGTAMLQVVRTAGPIYTLAVQGADATAPGTPVTVTAGGVFNLVNDGTGGDGGTVQAIVDATALAAAITTNGTYDATVLLSSSADVPAFTLTTPVTIPDGTSTFRIVRTSGPLAYTLAVKGPTASAFGTAVAVTAGGEFTIVDDGTLGSGGSVRVLVDATLLAAAITVDGNYDNTAVLSTHGPRAGTATVAIDQFAVGSKYDVTYQAKKTVADFVPVAFDSLALLRVLHGNVSASTGVDHLSVGGYPYFNEGGQTVYAVPLKDKKIVGATDGYDLDEPTGVGYTAAVEAALVQLEDVADVTLVIVLSPSEAIGSGNYRPGILNAVLSHVNRMSSTPSRKPRMAILGAVAGATNETIFSGTASAARSPRIVYMAPSTALLNVEGFSKVADGSTIAAALAGILSSGIDAGEPIMKKRLTSFVDIPDPFTLTQKNRLAGTYGLTIVEKVGGVPTIRDFLTTDVTNVLTGNAKVTVLEIDIRKSLQSTLDATVIGTRLVGNESLGEIRRMVEFVLERKRTARIITQGEVVNIAVDPTVPDQVNVNVRVVPVFDTKWVYVNTVFQTA